MIWRAVITKFQLFLRNQLFDRGKGTLRSNSPVASQSSESLKIALSVAVLVLGYISFMYWMYLFNEDTGTKEDIIGNLDSVEMLFSDFATLCRIGGIIYVCIWRQDSWPVELIIHCVLTGICHQIMGCKAMMRVMIDAVLLSIWIICTRVGGLHGVIQEILI